MEEKAPSVPKIDHIEEAILKAIQCKGEAQFLFSSSNFSDARDKYLEALGCLHVSCSSNVLLIFHSFCFQYLSSEDLSNVQRASIFELVISNALVKEFLSLLMSPTSLSLVTTTLLFAAPIWVVMLKARPLQRMFVLFLRFFGFLNFFC